MAKKKTQAKSWTFMVYMAGDNNLDPERRRRPQGNEKDRVDR